MQVKKDIMWRINGFFILLCVMGLVILGQILKIQIKEGDKLRSLADSLTLKYINIAASRGNIFSSDGMLMSTSVPIYDVRIDTRTEAFSGDSFNSNIDSLSICLSYLFKDHSAAEYKSAIREARSHQERYFLVKRNVSYTELQQLKAFPLFRMGRFKGGLRIEQKEKRELPFKDLASRTIGYMRDVKPVGIESAYNEDLKGVGGKRLMQKISGNVWMPVTDKDVVEPKDGNDLITTIDVNIQDVAEHSLEENLIKHNADHGCAVLMEVATGEIKAIVNLSRNENGNYEEDFNYVIGEATEPGSTMKLASVLAAIDDGLVEPNDTINVGNGEYMYYGQSMKDSHAPKSSRLSMQQSFETSSNVGISKMILAAYSKKPQAFIDKIKSFGLGKQLGLEIEGEGNPRIKNTNDSLWSPVSLPWMSIGYEVLLTPLQILTFYNAVANNGTMVKPHLIREIRNHGKLIKSFTTQIIKDSIASPASLEKAKRMMEGVVEHGTASSLNKSQYRIAGKTGTAQISHNIFGYDKNHRSYQASFVGYFPADAPKYSCMVVVYSPSNNVYFGGAVAAPIFKEIADKVYSNHLELHGVQNDTDFLVNHLPLVKAGQQNELKKIFAELKIPATSKDDAAQIINASVGDERVVLNERKSQTGMVPDVRGMSVKDAVYILENAGMRVQCNGRGSVIHQSLTPGMKISKGQLIFIELGI
jgi:cell division protein FtsI (penicillin-binding protein 3)